MKNKPWLGWLIFVAVVATVNLLQYYGKLDLGFWLI